MDQARDDGAGGAGVVVDRRYRHDLLAVAVGGLEDGAGDAGPGLDRAGAHAVVGAIGGRASPARGRRPPPCHA